MVVIAKQVCYEDKLSSHSSGRRNEFMVSKAVSDYLDFQGIKNGYLLIYDFDKSKE